jgi:hypothetical protein
MYFSIPFSFYPFILRNVKKIVTKTEAKFEEKNPNWQPKKGALATSPGLPLAVQRGGCHRGLGVRPLGGPGLRAGAAGWGSGLGRRAGRLAEPYGCFGH